MKRISHILLLLLGLVILLPTAQARAIRVAVFPVDDLSKEHNSINLPMTRFLMSQVEARGLSVVALEQVTDFMGKNRIRRLGNLQTLEIIAARRALDADLVLLASLCQSGDRPLSIGMTASLIRTSDGKTVWTNSRGVSQLVAQGLLGRNTPDSIDTLLPRLAQRLFSTWPESLDYTAGRELAGAQYAAVQETGYVQVDTVFFRPKYVRPGQKVECTVRFKNFDASVEDARVFIKVGNRIHLARSKDGIYYQAAWVGSEDKKGQRVKVAMNGIFSFSYFPLRVTTFLGILMSSVSFMLMVGFDIFLRF